MIQRGEDFELHAVRVREAEESAADDAAFDRRREEITREALEAKLQMLHGLRLKVLAEIESVERDLKVYRSVDNRFYTRVPSDLQAEVDLIVSENIRPEWFADVIGPRLGKYYAGRHDADHITEAIKSL